MEDDKRAAKSVSQSACRAGSECGVEGVLVGGSLRLVVYGKVDAKAAADLGSVIDGLGTTIDSNRVSVELADRSVFAPYARRWLERRYERAHAAAFTRSDALGDRALSESVRPLLQPSSGV